MGNSTLALTFVVVLNVFLWLSQVAILDLNPSGQTFYNCEGTIIGSSTTNCNNGSTINLNSDVAGQLPESQNVDVSTNPFTDIFNNILGWIKGVTGINYLVSIVSAPTSLMKSIGLPNQLAIGLGVMWYVISLFIVVSFLWGRE